MSCALVMPTDEPSVAGLTNTGKRNFFAASASTFARRLFPFRPQNRDEIADGQACLQEQPLLHILVHAHSRARSRPSRHKAARPVPEVPARCHLRHRCREAPETPRPRAAHLPPIPSSGTSAATLGSAVNMTRSPVAQHFGQHFLRRRAGQPAAVLGDADRHGFVFVAGRARESPKPPRPGKLRARRNVRQKSRRLAAVFSLHVILSVAAYQSHPATEFSFPSADRIISRPAAPSCCAGRSPD